MGPADPVVPFGPVGRRKEVRSLSVVCRYREARQTLRDKISSTKSFSLNPYQVVLEVRECQEDLQLPITTKKELFKGLLKKTEWFKVK